MAAKKMPTTPIKSQGGFKAGKARLQTSGTAPGHFSKTGKRKTNAAPKKSGPGSHSYSNVRLQNAD